jgi:hypothetical protein
MKNHQKLRDSVFTCPGCIGVRTYTWSTYRRHYSKAHAASVAMIMVLDDVACHVRNAWALALSAVIKFFELTEHCMADPVIRERMKEGEGESYSSTIGGYYPPKEIDTLKTLIKSQQEYLLPGHMARDLKPGAERRADGTKKRREPDAGIPGGQWKIPRSRKTSEESTGYQVVERKKPRKTYSEAAVPAENPREEPSAEKLDWNWECEREIAARSIAQAAQERRAAEKAAAERKQREYRPEEIVPAGYSGKNAAAASPGTLASLMDAAGMLDENSSSEDEDVVMDTRIVDEVLDNSDVDS